MNRVSPVGNPDNPQKRKRLSTACNRCRSRKLRCDDRSLACTNCNKANAECITRDPRQPHIEVERREAQSLGQSPLRGTSSREQAQLTPIDVEPQLHVPDGAQIIPEAGLTRLQQYHEATTDLFSGPLPAIPIFRSGNCLFMLTQWLDLAFARIGLRERLSWHYKADRKRPRDHTFEAYTHSADLGSWTKEDHPAITTFMSHINSVFPMIDSSQILQTLSDASDVSRSVAERILQQLILALGSTEMSNVGHTRKCDRILEFAFSNLTTLIRDDSIESIKALVLMALLFRSYDDSEMAWRMLAIAVPKAQALSLDRSLPSNPRSRQVGSTSQRELHTWLSLFVLDKVLAAELQRPPMVRDCFYVQKLLANQGTGGEGSTQKACFSAIVELARIQGQICERLLICSQEEESGRLTLEQAIKAKMKAGGELDRLLLDWAHQLPDDLRPSEYPSCDTVDLPAVAFLAIQYYQSLFLIHRNSLLINQQTLKGSINAYFSNASYRLRLQNGAAICMNTARSIANILNHTLQDSANSHLHSLYAPSISVYALAIHILKNPTLANVKTDLEILNSAARIIQRHESRYGNSPSAISTKIQNLVSQISVRVDSFSKQSSLLMLDETGPSQTTIPLDLAESPGDGQSGYNSHNQLNRVTEGSSQENVSWLMTMEEMDLFNSGLDETELDWNAIALTLDLPYL